MSKGTNHDVKSVGMEEEYENGEGCATEVMNKGALSLDVP